MTKEERIAKAEADFAIANEITKYGYAAAHAAALAWYDLHGEKLHYWSKATNAQRAAHVRQHADGMIECAKKITADGRAHYIREDHVSDTKILVVCTLIPDSLAGPVGYLPWDFA